VNYQPLPRFSKREKTPYRSALDVQYIVELRPANSGEDYLFLQRGVTHGQLQGPAKLKMVDPVPGPNVPGNVRPVVVGEIDPNLGTIIYYADQGD
jgi:hypothetical protein